MERKVNISGIIISMVRPCTCCLGSSETGVTIFCCTHMVAPTRSAINRSGDARFIHRKLLLRGSDE